MSILYFLVSDLYSPESANKYLIWLICWEYVSKYSPVMRLVSMPPIYNNFMVDLIRQERVEPSNKPRLSA